MDGQYGANVKGLKFDAVKMTLDDYEYEFT